MRASQAFFVAGLAVACSVAPQVVEAGPCSSNIAQLETTIQQPGVKALGPGQQSVNIQLGIRAAQESSTWADEHLQSQFSATIPATLLSLDLLLDIAKLVLAKEHSHATKNVGQPKRATIDRVLGQFPQAVLYIPIVRPRHQPIGVEPEEISASWIIFGSSIFFGSSYI